MASTGTMLLATPKHSQRHNLDLPRRIIPSPEKASRVEHHTIEFSPPKKQAISTLSPDSPTPKGLGRKSKPLVNTSARHIVFDFTLIDGTTARQPSSDEFEMLSALYPAQYSTGVYGYFLIIRVKQLPDRPWPLTVAGLLLYITTDENEMPWAFGMPKIHSHRRVLEGINARDYVSDELFRAAIKWFDEESTVIISSILWAGGTWQITIPDNSDISSLPFVLGKALCTYIYESEIPYQRGAALRQMTPTTLVRDSSTYNILRPGVMISSAPFVGTSSRSELYTTAGVLVKDKSGSKYMTVADHGFPVGEEEVYHPDPNGVHIGTIENRLGDTDIALVKLRDGIKFENSSFQSAHQPRGVEFSRVTRNENLKIADTLAMDNPFTGYIESVYYGTELHRIPEDGGFPLYKWLVTHWSWFGQESDKIPTDGSCGSPIWDENGGLVSFFRFLAIDRPRKGFGLGISATELNRFELEL